MHCGFSIFKHIFQIVKGASFRVQRIPVPCLQILQKKIKHMFADVCCRFYGKTSIRLQLLNASGLFGQRSAGGCHDGFPCTPESLDGLEAKDARGNGMIETSASRYLLVLRGKCPLQRV